MFFTSFRSWRDCINFKHDVYWSIYSFTKHLNWRDRLNLCMMSTETSSLDKTSKWRDRLNLWHDIYLNIFFGTQHLKLRDRLNLWHDVYRSIFIYARHPSSRKYVIFETRKTREEHHERLKRSTTSCHPLVKRETCYLHASSCPAWADMKIFSHLLWKTRQKLAMPCLLNLPCVS